MNRSVLLVVLVGCGGGADPLDKIENVRIWANSASAIGAYEVVREPVGFFQQAHEYPDPACPVAARNEAGASIAGGCTDSQGHAWVGNASVVQQGTTIRVDLDNFGNDAFGATRSNGFVIIEEVSPDEHSFEVDVTSIGGVTTTVVYSGTVVGTYGGPTTWNGSGTVRKSGDFFDGAGGISAETVDQVRDDDACAGEGYSGTTTMTSTEHVVVITYDGETDCDSEHSARWSLDGEDQGTISEITCSAGGASGFGALVLVGAVVLRRRRR